MSKKDDLIQELGYHLDNERQKNVSLAYQMAKLEEKLQRFYNYGFEIDLGYGIKFKDERLFVDGKEYTFALTSAQTETASWQGIKSDQSIKLEILGYKKASE